MPGFRKLRTKVFVVEDNAVLRDRYAKELGELAHVELCGVAATAAAAVEGIERAMPDLVILDLSLKDSSGLDVLRANEGKAKPRFVVVTSHAEASIEKVCLELGAERFFDKSNGFGELMDYLG
ncbi:MAG: response regulator [Candidatus Solibacter usitatus]|nr:response regulator [Candidatus Solibacter usitatus]